MLDEIRTERYRGWEGRDYAGSGVMNSRPKQNPLRERTIAVSREGVGVSNSTSSKSPGLSRMPAYKTMPPSLSSVPRPSTTVVENPLEVTTRTGKSTGRRSQRRVLGDLGITLHHRTDGEGFQITKVKPDPGQKYTGVGQACNVNRTQPLLAEGKAAA